MNTESGQSGAPVLAPLDLQQALARLLAGQATSTDSALVRRALDTGQLASVGGAGAAWLWRCSAATGRNSPAGGWRCEGALCRLAKALVRYVRVY